MHIHTASRLLYCLSDYQAHWLSFLLVLSFVVIVCAVPCGRLSPAVCKRTLNFSLCVSCCIVNDVHSVEQPVGITCRYTQATGNERHTDPLVARARCRLEEHSTVRRVPQSESYVTRLFSTGVGSSRICLLRGEWRTVFALPIMVCFLI